MVEGISDHRTAPVDAGAAHGAAAATVDLPGRWRLLELLGSGGQATVWLAEDRTLGQKVALKVLPANADERTRARWLEEVRQGRRLSHPHLIRIFDVVETSDRPVAVMEFVPGGTLADRVVAGGAQPIEDVIRWTGEVLEVLTYLHENRIVHRDVKPSNLLVAEDGSIKLSDLGLVRSLDRGSDLTRTLEGVGTPRFMSPEQLKGEAPTPACDLYSLGVTMYQLLAGRLPFDGDSAFQIADGHLHLRPPGIREHRPECPRWLARFVEKLLEKNPAERFGSAEHARSVLDRRWVGLSRRTLTVPATVAAVVAIAFLGGVVVRSVITPTLDRVEIEDDLVVARSADNAEMWSVRRESERPRAVVADFVGDSRAEVAIGWSPATGETDPEATVVFELRSDRGDVLRTFDTSGLSQTLFPEVTPVWFLRSMATADVLGTGNDLVWSLVHPRWFSSVIGVTSFREAASRLNVLFANSGHSQLERAADLDGDGVDEIVAVAINNPMGFQRVLITFGARSRLTGESCARMISPDLDAFSQARTIVANGCFSYTPLGSGVQVVDEPKVTEDGIELLVDGEVRRFDVWGNPEGTPSYGKGGQAREAFWRDLALTAARLRLSDRIDPPFTMSRLMSNHPEIAAEQAMEVAAVLVVARALASGGHRENAIALLREGLERYPEESDLRLRLGEQLLISGRRVEGRRWVADSIGVGTSGRSHTDLVFMLILDAAIHGDRRAYDETRRFLGNLTASTSNQAIAFLDMTWHFFQGDWSDPRLLESDPGWVHLWLRLVQAWARFEMTFEAEPALASVSALEPLEETRDLSDLLEARVRLSQGDATAAAPLAEGALQNLDADCRLSFEACAWLPLAEWVAGRALTEIDGREAEGRALLDAAAKHAPNTWIATPLTQ
ncbi:MAG: serine/threonine-protein kinase [Candidatus Sulfomarinibacteraceae bacterium]